MKGEAKGREIKNSNERETWIDRLPPASPILVIEPQTPTCALTWSRIGDLLGRFSTIESPGRFNFIFS